MFFDVLIIIIIVACAVFGFRNGFLVSLSRIGGWLGALAIAFFFRERISDWLIENTSFYENTQARVEKVCQSFVENYDGAADSSGDAGGFGSILSRIGEKLASAAAEQITSHLWTVIVFISIVIGVKIILFVLTLLLSKRFHGGMLGGIDGIAGLLFGLFQAAVAILVVFAFILPISYTINAKAHENIQKSMDNSYVAKFIYENNPLLDFIDGFLPTGLTPGKWLDQSNYQNVMNASGEDWMPEEPADSVDDDLDDDHDDDPDSDLLSESS